VPMKQSEPVIHIDPEPGTTREQLRPRTGQEGGAGPPRKQDESTR
jgi:hypothetical protein